LLMLTHYKKLKTSHYKNKNRYLAYCSRVKNWTGRKRSKWRSWLS
jgi:hypothetical protein